MNRTPSRAAGVAALVAALAVLAGCNRGAPPPRQMPPGKVTVVNPVAYPVQEYSQYNGYLDTTQAVEVRARVKGILTEVLFVEGTEVAAGAPLYVIDDREFQTAVKKAEAELEKSKADIELWTAQIDLAKTELTRAKEAASSLAASQTDVDKAAATLAVNKAQLAAAVATKNAAESSLHTANIQLGYTDIRAKIAGRINRTLVDEGNLVGQNEATLLTTIVAMDPLYINFDVPERDLVAYQLAQRKGDRPLPDVTSRRIPVEVGVATEDGYPHAGVIDFRENRVDTGTGTVRIRGRVPNPGSPPAVCLMAVVGPVGPAVVPPNRLLYPGLYARVRVPFGPPKSLPVIPEDALMAGQQGQYVYVVGPDKKVAMRVVTVGPRVYRAPPAAENKPSAWVLNDPNPPPPGGGKDAKPGPAVPPLPSKIPVRSVVAIEKGLGVDDVVIVNGLQKARPGGEVAPDMWQFNGPAAGK